MDYTYQLDSYGNSIIRVEDRTFIPFDPDNTDYQEYLAWVAEGNEPLPVDGTEVTWDTIRAKRDRLIAASDWTMIPGATVDQAQWSAYRQILRDLPQTYSDPEDVVWPTAPSTSGPNTCLLYTSDAADE